MNERNWRWFSTPRSAEKGELSVLAICETIAAMYISMWLVTQGYILHLVVSAFVAPFLLLRTSISIEQGLRISELLGDKVTTSFFYILPIQISSNELSRTAICTLLLTPIYAVIFLYARISSTVVTVLKNPFAAVKVIPKNWWRIAGCTDTAHWPEAIPGSYRSNTMFVKTWGYLFGNLDSESEKDSSRSFLEEFFIFYPVLLFASVFLIVPSLLYRWSLKGSSVVYLPLMWAASGNVRERLVAIKDPFPTFRRWLGCFVIGVVTIKFLIPTVWVAIQPVLKQLDATGFLTLLVAPTTIPKWQIASAINSIMAWAMLWFGFPILRKTNDRPLSATVEIVIRFVGFVSLILSLYTIAVLIYNVATIQWNFVSIGEKWFPW